MRTRWGRSARGCCTSLLGRRELGARGQRGAIANRSRGEGGEGEGGEGLLYIIFGARWVAAAGATAE